MLRFRNISTLLLSVAATASAQNITDLSVMDSAVATHMVQSGLSTVDLSVFPYPDRISMDNRCLKIEGVDTFIFSGTMHYFRVDKSEWRDRLLKMKEAGFNAVETYIPWNWHEREMPSSVNDFSKIDLSDFEDFISMAEDLGFYLIVRPGPYICAEWSGGGFPQWIMQKRPQQSLHEVWLQSIDPTFMAWNEHWYKAVCKAVAPHQITAKAKGEAGVILFQIENEYNRIKWFPALEKKEYLEQLAQIARNNGINVPLITCWTSEARNVDTGPLHGVVDMVNSYPKWNIEKSFGKLINQQLATQPGKPLISGELQGGWCAELSTPLSCDQDGLSPAQTQNVALYALQRGFSAINFYMAVGGTNFDDWAARHQTTTYDYAAAIGEDGAVNERWRRFKSLAPLMLEHGVKIASANELSVKYRVSDPDVKVAVRECADGSRYYFVRTENHQSGSTGSIYIADDIAFDYTLEPFGSKVYYVKAGARYGEWFPKSIDGDARPAYPIDTIRPINASSAVLDLPAKFTALKHGESVDAKGIQHRHPLVYRVETVSGKDLTVERIGEGVENRSEADRVWVVVNGKPCRVVSEKANEITFAVPSSGTKAQKTVAYIYFENHGLHHHTNLAVEQNWAIGPKYVKCDGKELRLSFAEVEQGKPGKASFGAVRYEYQFDIKQNHVAVNVPFYLRLRHQGNGFITVNGRTLGRCWDFDAQREYYIPAAWLHDGRNDIAVTLMPADNNTVGSVSEAVLISHGDHAEAVRDAKTAYWGDQRDGTYRNPILSADYSDPDPLRVGDDYYYNINNKQ
jgi:hypothetical protein